MKKRGNVLGTVFRGVIVSAAITMAGILLTAAAVILTNVSDSTLGVCNQALKLMAIICGVRLSVGRGGENGFVTGLCSAVIYMILGYGMYMLLGGAAFSWMGMLGEMLLGGSVGAVTGAILANMSPRRKRARA